MPGILDQFIMHTFLDHLSRSADKADTRLPKTPVPVVVVPPAGAPGALGPAGPLGTGFSSTSPGVVGRARAARARAAILGDFLKETL